MKRRSNNRSADRALNGAQAGSDLLIRDRDRDRDALLLSKSKKSELEDEDREEEWNSTCDQVEWTRDWEGRTERRSVGDLLRYAFAPQEQQEIRGESVLVVVVRHEEQGTMKMKVYKHISRVILAHSMSCFSCFLLACLRTDGRGQRTGRR